MITDNFQGAVESISIREVRLSIRQSLVKIGAGLISRDPKLHLLICGLKVVTRASSKSTKKTSSKRTRSRKSRKIGRRKWMAVANIAKFLSVSVTETIVKVSLVPIIILDLFVIYDYCFTCPFLSPYCCTKNSNGCCFCRYLFVKFMTVFNCVC